MLARTQNTEIDRISWITFSCNSVYGPPLSINPILFAGIWKQYSINAIPQLNRMIAMSGQFVEIPIWLSFRWPYHAIVIKTFANSSKKTGKKYCIIVSIKIPSYDKFITGNWLTNHRTRRIRRVLLSSFCLCLILPRHHRILVGNPHTVC